MGIAVSPGEEATGLRARAAVATASEPLIAIALALAVGAIVVLVAGGSPATAYTALYDSSLGSLDAVAESLRNAIPIILVGIGMGLAFKVGLFNIGGEGQMVFGALAAAVVGHALAGLPTVLLMPLVFVAGCLAAGLWAMLPGWWEVRFGAPLVITTLLLNYIADLLGTYLVTYPLRDATGGSTVAQSAPVPDKLLLPTIVPNTTLHIGVIAIVIVPVLLLVLLNRTVAGYRMRMSGLNRGFAEYGGVPMRRTVLTTMLLSGAVCGLAGVLYVLGDTQRYIDGSINGPILAWLGLVAALLARYHPGWTVLTGFFLGALSQGGTGLQLQTDVPLQLVNVIQAVLILMIAARLALGFVARRALGVRSA